MGAAAPMPLVHTFPSQCDCHMNAFSSVCACQDPGQLSHIVRYTSGCGHVTAKVIYNRYKSLFFKCW